jgi:adenosylhomocysteine nucleosidase
MRIVSTFAVPSEFAPWRRMRTFQLTGSGRIPIYYAQIGRAEVYAVVTGIGMRNIRDQFETLLKTSADICIASGLAGGLRKEHRTGAVLIARTVMRSDSHQIASSSEQLVEIGIRCGATPVRTFQSRAAVVTSAVEKQRLSAAADAVDVESFDVLNEAQRCGLPAVAIRAVSDPVEQDMPLDFNRTINDRGAIDWLSMVSEIARAPRRLPDLVRFGRGSVQAARNLARVLDRYVMELG